MLCFAVFLYLTDGQNTTDGFERAFKRPEEFHIPQIPIGNSSAHQRASVILALPALIRWETFPNHERTVSEAVRQRVYEILRETVVKYVHEGEDGHWLPTYQAELARATAHNSRTPQSSGKLIPEECVSKFSEEFLQTIHGEDFGGEAYYICTVQGARAQTAHDAEAGSHLQAYEKLMDMLHTDHIDKEKWWVDIGHEVQLRKHVLWWRAESHLQIVQKVLQLEEGPAQALLNSSNYELNPAANLTEAAGFRLKIPAGKRGDSGIYWMQLYCTEKMATYLPGGNTPQLSTSILLKDTVKKLEKFSQTLNTTFMACANAKTSGHARLEVRVQLSRFDINHPIIIELNPQFVNECIYKFPSTDWW
jgi:hypothetical protein